MNNDVLANETLTNLVDKFRDLARKLLRLRWINNIKDCILSLEKNIKTLSEIKDGYTKRIIRNEYALSKLDPSDPDYDTKKKNLESDNEEYIKLNESYQKDIEEVQKQIAKQNEEIAKVESGESKVNAENLSTKAKELAEEYTKELARQVK